MIYPQGKTIHQNLSAEYTDVPQLLSALKSSSFSGIVEIDAGGKKGAFFIAAGQVANAAIGLDSDPPAIVGDRAVQELFALARQPQGLLNVFELTTAQVELAAGPLISELLFKELSTDFIRLDQFVKKLTDEKHTGYMEISGKDGHRIGTLSFRIGDVVGLQTISESGNTTLFEGEAIPSILENAVRDGAIFNVYRSAGISNPAPGALDVTPQGVEKASRDKTPPPGARPARERKPVNEAPAEPQEQAIPVEPEVQADPVEPLKEPPPVEVRVESEETFDASMNGRREFLSALQRVLSKIESFADHMSRKGDFQRLFRQTCVDRSDIYHFLDPFEGQFEYDSGKIRLDDAIASEEFAAAIAQCLNLVLMSLNEEFFKGAALPPGLKGEIESAFRHYKEVLKDCGLHSVVPASVR